MTKCPSKVLLLCIGSLASANLLGCGNDVRASLLVEDSQTNQGAEPYLQVLQFGKDGVENHIFPWKLDADKVIGVSFKAMTVSDALRSDLYSTVESLNYSQKVSDPRLSDLATSLEREVKVVRKGSTLTIELSSSPRFFSKSLARAYYVIFTDKSGAPLPLDKRGVATWKWWLTEPRETAGGSFPLRGLLDRKIINLHSAPTTGWQYDTAGRLAYRISALKDNALEPAPIPKRIDSQKSSISGVTHLVLPKRPRAWIVCFFQPGVAKKLASFAKDLDLGLSSIVGSSDWSQISTSVHKLSSEVQARSGSQVPIFTTGFSAGGITAWNSALWFPESIKGAVCDGHYDLGELQLNGKAATSTMRSLPITSMALLSGRNDASNEWAKQAHEEGLARKQRRLLIQHEGGHDTAPISAYKQALKWLLGVK